MYLILGSLDHERSSWRCTAIIQVHILKVRITRDCGAVMRQILEVGETQHYSSGNARSELQMLVFKSEEIYNVLPPSHNTFSLPENKGYLLLCCRMTCEQVGPL
jgi:hypothetical protein